MGSGSASCPAVWGTSRCVEPLVDLEDFLDRPDVVLRLLQPHDLQEEVRVFWRQFLPDVGVARTGVVGGKGSIGIAVIALELA